MNLFKDKESIKSTDAGDYILEERKKFKLKHFEYPKSMFINSEFYNMLDHGLALITTTSTLYGMKVFKDDNILEHDIVMR
jgi:hypothetical protein